MRECNKNNKDNKDKGMDKKISRQGPRDKERRDAYRL
jgi:hypothetical protein